MFNNKVNSNPPPPNDKPSLTGSGGLESKLALAKELATPPVDGTLEIKGPYGKCVLLLELSEGTNSAHIETKIGQRLYTIDIRPSLGLGTTMCTVDWDNPECKGCEVCS